ncbi:MULTISPECIES: glycosyl hydrolase family 95 catalytic domain-containing protein [Sphingobacterium]|uniref:glycoside hydrolase family 95 protein n=1 Tax=Sphingobacterium TaxID=28453 RepID=UPI0019373BF8|nr:glycoside hydrolase family 95 protein [Sphingobacterium sp. UDSM-2020]QQD12507.1 glycoside hydrolase family 95 protein [Sphingobacterium sp. UDSM-2020]
MLKSQRAYIFILVLIFFVKTNVYGQQYFLWDDQPAKDWMTEAYPIGNGRIGAMIFGGVNKEHIQFNENSLWTGNEQETGEYQAFGEVFIEFGQVGAKPFSNYSRKLDLDQALHHITYNQGNQKRSRRYFASNPDQVMVMEYTNENKKSLNATIRLKDSHGKLTKSIAGDLVFSGVLSNGMEYAARLHVKTEGGEVLETKGEDGEIFIQVQSADKIVILLSAATDYANTRSTNWKANEKPLEANKRYIQEAAKYHFDQLLTRHLKDYPSLFARVQLQLGTEDLSQELTTKKLLQHYKQKPSPALESLIYQYGRYLLISSSRKGGLPANLQGLWNNSNTPPWRSDYHSNINVQMNYWPAEVANLSESAWPYLDYINSMREVKKENTQKEFPGVRGWTVRTENNIFGGESFSWNTPGSAWYAQALWEHYAFNRDKAYLRDFAYPILKEICQFWDDRLVRRDDGTVVAPMGWSPEHGPTEDAVSYDHQIIFDLFTNYVEACQILQIDKAYGKHIETLRNALLKPKIGKWGQLQEWETDRDDPNDKHRHVSHLFGLYPGRQISKWETPELANAAKVTLNARGDESTGWSMAWKVAFWARLQDGNHAYLILKNFINLVGGEGIDYDNGGGVYANLLCAHPPFQIDGNLGYVAAVSEMIVQSQNNMIELLPALPDNWKDGKIKGLKARGNILIHELIWKNKQVESVVLRSLEHQTIQLLSATALKDAKLIKEVNGKYIYQLQLKPNQKINLKRDVVN